MKYVTEQYQQQLEDLAETLMARKREQLAQPMGELLIFPVRPEGPIPA